MNINYFQIGFVKQSMMVVSQIQLFYQNQYDIISRELDDIYIDESLSIKYRIQIVFTIGTFENLH